MFLEALKCLLEDEGFHLPTQPAISASTAAEGLLRWASNRENCDKLDVFANELVTILKACIDGSSGRACQQARREKMWSKYYQVRTSETFRAKWHEFLETSIRSRSTPLFWQYVSNEVFRALVKEAFKPSHSDQMAAEEITYQEANALRYTAGYICRSMKRKLAVANHPLKEELILAIDSMCKDDGSSEDSEPTTSQHWIASIDRGGLCHVKDVTYMVFLAMEENLRHHLKVSNVREMNSDFRDKVVMELVKNDDVNFYWCMLALDLDAEKESVLLKLLVEHWVTVRGFSFAGAYMEMYKQYTKRSLQRSKGLRTTLSK